MKCPHCAIPLPDDLPTVPFGCPCGGFFQVLAGEAVPYEPTDDERMLNFVVRVWMDRREQRRKAMMN